jgi:hypothetical protein
MQVYMPDLSRLANICNLQIWEEGKQLYLGGFDSEEQVRIVLHIN